MPSDAARLSDQTRLDRIGEILSRGVVALSSSSRESSIAEEAGEAAMLIGLDEELASIASLARRIGGISIGDVMSSFKVSRTTAHRRLTRLVDQGCLVRNGEGRASRYLPHASCKTKK